MEQTDVQKAINQIEFWINGPRDFDQGMMILGNRLKHGAPGSARKIWSSLNSFRRSSRHKSSPETGEHFKMKLEHALRRDLARLKSLLPEVQAPVEKNPASVIIKEWKPNGYNELPAAEKIKLWMEKGGTYEEGRELCISLRPEDFPSLHGLAFTRPYLPEPGDSRLQDANTSRRILNHWFGCLLNLL